jgi:hypothetical protein
MTISVPPAPYLRLTSFSGQSPYRDASLGVSMDNEFNAIQVAVNALETRLALIQRNDGNLLNGSVGPDQLGFGLTSQSISSIQTLGIGATNTTPNVLTVGGASSLFTNLSGGTDCSVVISKAGATNEASILLQDNLSSRAEIGLMGDDNLHFMVSSDGVTFVDALDIGPTGIASAITPAGSDNSTRLATTAFVAGNFIPQLGTSSLSLTGGVFAVVNLYTSPPANGVFLSGAGPEFSNLPLIGGLAGDHQRSSVYIKSTAAQDATIAEYMVTIDSNLNSGKTRVWAISTSYSLNEQVIVLGSANIYLCTTAGISAGSGSGPAGTGTGIVDGAARWSYLASDFAASKVGFFNSAITGPLASYNSWGMANDFIIDAADIGGFKAGAEFDCQNKGAGGTPGVRNVYNVYISGTVVNPLTAQLGISTLGVTAGAHYGILINGVVASDADIGIEGSTAAVGLDLGGLVACTYSTAAIRSAGFLVNPAGNVKISGAATLSVLPTGNAATTLAASNVQGSSASSTTREYYQSIGFTANTASAGAFSDIDSKVAQYVGCTVSSGAKAGWASNELLTLNTPLNANFFAALTKESDFNNLSGNNFHNSYGAVGGLTQYVGNMLITGSSTSQVDFAICIGGLNTSTSLGMYNRGILFMAGLGARQADIQSESSAATFLADFGTHSKGLDLAGTYSVAALASPGFILDGLGNIAALGGTIGTAVTNTISFYGAARVARRSAGNNAVVPAGGTGAAAGGWDTAAHRDAAIATINEIRTTLVNLGLMPAT